MIIAVMDACSHSGRVIADLLVKADVTVRAIASHNDAKRPVPGATMCIGDADDVAFLTESFRGADAAYITLPRNLKSPNYRAERDRVTTAIATAVSHAGLKRAVVRSSIGVDMKRLEGMVVGLRVLEERLKAVPSVSLLILRPGYLFDEIFESLDVIRTSGEHTGAIAGDTAFPMVAWSDVAREAVRVLADPHFNGVEIKEMLGARDYSLNEVTAALGVAIGSPALAYVQCSYDALASALTTIGVSPNVAELKVASAWAINDGLMNSSVTWRDRSKLATTLDEFVPRLVVGYNDSVELARLIAEQDAYYAW